MTKCVCFIGCDGGRQCGRRPLSACGTLRRSISTFAQHAGLRAQVTGIAALGAGPDGQVTGLAHPTRHRRTWRSAGAGFGAQETLDRCSGRVGICSRSVGRRRSVAPCPADRRKAADPAMAPAAVGVLADTRTPRARTMRLRGVATLGGSGFRSTPRRIAATLNDEPAIKLSLSKPFLVPRR